MSAQTPIFTLLIKACLSIDLPSQRTHNHHQKPLTTVMLLHYNSKQTETITQSMTVKEQDGTITVGEAVHYQNTLVWEPQDPLRQK